MAHRAGQAGRAELFKVSRSRQVRASQSVPSNQIEPARKSRKKDVKILDFMLILCWQRKSRKKVFDIDVKKCFAPKSEKKAMWVSGVWSLNSGVWSLDF